MGIQDETAPIGTVEWPPWVPRAFAASALLIAVAAPVTQHGAAITPGLVGLLAAALVPWAVVAMFPRPLPHVSPLLLGLLALAPLAVLNIWGEALGLLDLSDDLQLSKMLIILTVGFVAGCAPLWQSGSVAILALGIMVARSVMAPDFDAGWVWAIGLGFGFGGGLLANSQQRAVAELRAAQSALSEQAAADERRRIAREVHDVIAHTLSVTMLHLTAARLAVGRDPAAAAEALEEAERLGRESLGEIRRTVGLLRGGAERMETAALPGLGDLEQLVTDYRTAGLDIRLRLSGTRTEAGATPSLAAYRVVQESLTNAAKHAPGAPVDVEVAVADERIQVSVRNRMAGSGSADRQDGAGLAGMSERVALLDGWLAVGQDDDDWVVECALPTRLMGTAEAAPA